MKKNDLISVIIPTYNSAKTLKLCLDAIYKQKYSRFEVIVVYRESNDNSYDIAKEYPCKIIHQKDRGRSNGRNEGVKYAKGNILFFVDSDVALKPNSLSIAMKKFNLNSDIGAVCGIYCKKPLIRDSLVEEYRILQDYYWKKSTSGYITTLNVANGAIRKDVFSEIGGFNPKLNDSEDVEFGNRISKKYKIISTPEIQGYHDGDDKLMNILINFSRRAKERVSLFIKQKGFNKGYGTSNRGLGCVLATFSLFSLVLAFFNFMFIIPAILFFTSFLLTDGGLYGFILKEKGPLFLLYFTFIHYSVNIAILLGVAIGTINYFGAKSND